MIDLNRPIALDFNDVLIEPRPSNIKSRQEVDLVTTDKTIFSQATLTGIPIISANMSSVSTFDMARALTREGLYCALHKHYTIDEYNNFFNNAEAHELERTFITAGMHDMEILQNLDVYPKLICLDVANGYMTQFGAFVDKVRHLFPESTIMAGNVVTADGARMLIGNGADIVKVGIGSGSVCHTRLVAGVGVPQLTAILNVIETCHQYGVLVCSDGGITTAGDFSKAFVAGADFVMAGGIFSGHDECNMVKTTDEYGRTFMEYYGMSSEHAMNKHNGGMAKHRSSEGKVVRVNYKGSVTNTIDHILGGIRSTGSYIGTTKLRAFPLVGTLIPVRNTHNKIFGE
jgi:GMP reductase